MICLIVSTSGRGRKDFCRNRPGWCRWECSMNCELLYGSNNTLFCPQSKHRTSYVRRTSKQVWVRQVFVRLPSCILAFLACEFTSQWTTLLIKYVCYTYIQIYRYRYKHIHTIGHMHTQTKKLNFKYSQFLIEIKHLLVTEKAEDSFFFFEASPIWILHLIQSKERQ